MTQCTHSYERAKNVVVSKGYREVQLQQMLDTYIAVFTVDDAKAVIHLVHKPTHHMDLDPPSDDE